MKYKVLKSLIAAAALMTTLPATGIAAEEMAAPVILSDDINETKIYELTVGETAEFSFGIDYQEGEVNPVIPEGAAFSAEYDAEKDILKVTASEASDSVELKIVFGSGEEGKTSVYVFKASEKEEEPAEETVTEEIAEAPEAEEEIAVEEEPAAVPEEITEEVKEEAAEAEVTEEVIAEAEVTEDKAAENLNAVADGFVVDGGKTYYYKDNVALTGMQTIDGKKYYFDASGVQQTGWQTVGEYRYYFNSGSKPADRYAKNNGWNTIDGKKYYFNRGGSAKKGWFKENTANYYFGADNAVVTNGWKKIDGKWYFFNASGTRKHNCWYKEKGNYYFFNESGTMKHDCFFTEKGKTYYFDSTGKMVTGWKKISGKWYFFNPAGPMKKSTWYKENGKWYYFDNKGVMATKWKEVKGKWYYFLSNGVMKTGWTKVGKYWYFLNDSGAMRTGGWFEYKDQKYYILPSGVMKTGWLETDRAWYYFKDSGVMVKNTTMTIKGKSQKFAPEGEWIDWDYLYGLNYGFQLRVNRARCVMTVYGKDYEGNYTIPVFAVTVSVGMDETPTPLGWSTINSKHRWYYYKDDNCWLQYSQFFAHGTKMMHSEAYFSQDPSDMAVGEYYKLGRQASHGCIRMPVKYIKWIYDNCPIGTEVYVYDDWDYSGPYGKPAVPAITNGSAWDPTDPDPRSPYNN